MAVGIDQLKVIVEAVGEVINVVYKVTHGGGVFAAFSVMDELAALGTVKGDQIVQELKDLSPEERKDLLSVLKAKVSVSDKALEAKLESGADCLDEVVSFGFSVYNEGLLIKSKVELKLAEGKALLDKIKGLVA